MHIEKLNKSQSVSMKELYFVKGNPLFNHKYRYTGSNCVKLSKNGTQYIENLNITSETKGRLANIPFIKALAKKFETFVLYTGVLHDNVANNSVAIDRIEIYWANKKYKKAKNAIVAAGTVNKPYDNAKLFNILENDEKLNKKLENFAKSPIRFLSQHKYFEA